MLEQLRRRLALILCKELAELPVAEQHLEVKGRTKNFFMAEEIRKLDWAYSAFTGAQITRRSAPDYEGPMWEWPFSPALVRDRTVAAILRLRADRAAGVHHNTHFLALNYFVSIWPEGAEWPSTVRRPRCPPEDARPKDVRHG